MKLLFNKVILQKLSAYLLFVLMVYLLRDFALVFFLTFIFSYLFLAFGRFLKEKLDIFLGKVARKKESFLKNLFPLNLIITFLYLTFLGAIFFALSNLLPELTRELRDLPKYVPVLKEPIHMITLKLEEIKNINSQIGSSIYEIFSKQNIDIFVQVYEKVKAFGALFIKIVLSLILSYVFIIDREKLGEYLEGIKASNFGFLYNEYKAIVQKIVKTFGLAFKAQSMIALTNTLLTTIGLFIIGLIHHSTFPFIYTLAIVVFVCSFIPVLGTFISSIPILIIGYATFGTWSIVVEIVVLISFIHAIEAYYLNPKIVSSFMKLPLSLTLLILILSEHFMGFVGLIIGVSTFYLILELLKDADNVIDKSRYALSQMHDIKEDTKKHLKEDIRVSRKVDW